MSPRPQLTLQQSAAIFSHGASVALSAGAGCGKTFVLTRRFLAGLEPGRASTDRNELHSLVAITFTDRAAREMRDRIRAACHDRLQNCPVEHVEHWLGILRGLDSARISTIHSFCTGLLRSQAVEAGIDPRFAVLEPALANTLLRRVVRDTLHQLIETQNDDAVQFVVEFGLERAKDLLVQLVTQRFQMDFSKFVEITAKELAMEWLRRWKTEFVPKLVTKMRQSPTIENVLELISKSPSKNEKMKDRIAYLSSVLPVQTPWKDVITTLDEISANARVQGGGGKNDWASDEQHDWIMLALEKLRSEIKELRELLSFREEDVMTAAELACRGLRLTEQMADQYSTAKRTQGGLDFDDLLLQARNLLRDNADVRNRVAAGIHLLMVDEFQDTDPVQADVVRSLCGAALAHGKLFMVGDRKQSIYRFRRADPTVFESMSQELPESGRLPLNVNFRSQPAILNFVNRLFAPAMEGYEPLTPFPNEQLSPTPAIEFLFATFDADGADAIPPASSDDEDDLRPKAAELRAREADWIARRIAALLNDETPRIRTKAVDAKGRTILRRTKPGDIVILFRALTSVQDYEGALRRYGLEYYLVGGKAFFAQQEIFDILNLCRYIDDCDDLIGLVGVLRSPFFNISDDSIQALSFHSLASAAATDMNRQQSSPQSSPGVRSSMSLHQTLQLEPPTYLPEDQRQRIRFAAEVLADLRANKDRIPLSALLTRAIERTGYDASLLIEFFGSRKLANLRKLVEMSRQFEQGEFFNLKDFVSRLQTSVLEETDEEFATTLPESGDIIRLMSIHQSKGLEFPIVIVADIDRKSPPRRGDSALHPELGPLIKPPEKFGHRAENLGMRMHHLSEQEADAEETIRLFYVACTRAADYLILSTGRDGDKPPHSPWLQLIESRFDSQTGLLKNDPLLGASEFGNAGRESVPDIRVHRIPYKAKRADSIHERRIPPGKLPGQVLTSDHGIFPESATVYNADLNEIPVISVSRLEAIDEELSGIQHAKRPRKQINPEDNEIDLDMATSLGTLVHAVLERVDLRNPVGWLNMLETEAKQANDPVNEESVLQAKAMLESFFESAISRDFSKAKSIHREIDFLLPWPGSQSRMKDAQTTVRKRDSMISGIIDVLIETEAGWHIFDYKTGVFPQSTPDQELLVPYRMQLGIYAHSVEQWFGATPRELSLIVFRPKVRRVTLDWSPDRWGEIQTRIDRAIESLKTNRK